MFTNESGNADDEGDSNSRQKLSKVDFQFFFVRMRNAVYMLRKAGYTLGYELMISYFENIECDWDSVCVHFDCALPVWNT